MKCEQNLLPHTLHATHTHTHTHTHVRQQTHQVCLSSGACFLAGLMASPLHSRLRSHSFAASGETALAPEVKSQGRLALAPRIFRRTQALISQGLQTHAGPGAWLGLGVSCPALSLAPALRTSKPLSRGGHDFPLSIVCAPQTLGQSWTGNFRAFSYFEISWLI